MTQALYAHINNKRKMKKKIKTKTKTKTKTKKNSTCEKMYRRGRVQEIAQR
jgi:hypothetical protein